MHQEAEHHNSCVISFTVLQTCHTTKKYPFNWNNTVYTVHLVHLHMFLCKALNSQNLMKVNVHVCGE